MIDVYEIVKDWKTILNWSIAPAYISWCREGNRVKISEGVQFDYGVHIGNRVVIGTMATLYSNVTVGDGVHIGYNAIIGNYVKLGNNTSIGRRIILADGIHIGSDTQLGIVLKLQNTVIFAMDLGVQSGYRHTLIQLDNDTFWFVGGCHIFRYKEAKRYWKGKENRKDTLLALEFAKIIAKKRYREYNPFSITIPF